MAPCKGKATKAAVQPPEVTPATPTAIPIRQDSPAWREVDTGPTALATAATYHGHRDLGA